MTYEEDEILILTEDIKNIKGEIKLSKDQEVLFYKVTDNPTDLAQSLIAVKVEDKLMVLKENQVKPKDTNKLKKAVKALNLSLEKQNPKLRVYSDNLVKRYYFRVYYYIADKLDVIRKLIIKVLEK